MVSISFVHYLVTIIWLPHLFIWLPANYIFYQRLFHPWHTGTHAHCLCGSSGCAPGSILMDLLLFLPGWIHSLSSTMAIHLQWCSVRFANAMGIMMLTASDFLFFFHLSSLLFPDLTIWLSWFIYARFHFWLLVANYCVSAVFKLLLLKLPLHPSSSICRSLYFCDIGGVFNLWYLVTISLSVLCCEQSLPRLHSRSPPSAVWMCVMHTSAPFHGTATLT